MDNKGKMGCKENAVSESRADKTDCFASGRGEAQRHKSELLLPAGALVKLKTALLYGADAVYAGTPDMSLRTQSKFSLEERKREPHCP